LGIHLAVETDRYMLRETIAAVLRPWFFVRTLAEVSRELEAAQVLWSRYRTMCEAVADFHGSDSPTVLGEVDQPGIGPVVSARSPVRMGSSYGEPAAAPTLGQHTDEVLAEVLGLDGAELAALHDRGVVSAS
jgi:2-methylfumaryl-CoA isomerase